MKSRLLRWFIFGSMFLSTGVIHAQAACSPGTVPYGAGQGQNVCGPDNNQQHLQRQQQQPPPQWSRRWGAIATDGAGGHFGATAGVSTQGMAKQVALADCQSKGGTQCAIEVAYDNECAAMVIGDKGHNSGAAPTLDRAIQLGLDACARNGDTNCRVYYSACSLPVRIR
jgi:hypothetical protein